MKRILFLYLLCLSSLLHAQTTGSLTDTRDGRVYPTVKIGNQWWMAKGLNYGTRIDSTLDAADNGIAEKYCYRNSITNCYYYGAFYTWNELMNYSTKESTQGLCPANWHIPSDQEWMQLEINLGMSQSDASHTGWRGTSVGTQLKTGGSSGFNALLGGYRNSSKTFSGMNVNDYYWTSSIRYSDHMYMRMLANSQTGVSRYDYPPAYGLSVRCVREDSYCTPSYSSASDDEYIRAIHIMSNTDTFSYHAGTANFDSKTHYIDLSSSVWINAAVNSQPVIIVVFKINPVKGCIWIDLNNDYNLAADELIPVNSFNGNSVVYLPDISTLTPGTSYRMRFMSFHYTGYYAFLPCGSYTEGQCIDLTLKIGNAVTINDEFVEINTFPKPIMECIDYNDDNEPDYVDNTSSVICYTGTFDECYHNPNETDDGEGDEITYDLEVSDFNNDNLPDMLSFGESADNFMPAIHLFQRSLIGKSSGFIDSSLTFFTNRYYAVIHAFDYDNDGDNDILISGAEQIRSIPITMLYENKKTSWSPLLTNIPGIRNGDMASADYDNDADLDLLVTGQDINGNPYTGLFKNTNGTFQQVTIPVKDLKNSSCDWGDFNNDGLLDFLIQGFDGVDRLIMVYRNQGNDSFIAETLFCDVTVKGIRYLSNVEITYHGEILDSVWVSGDAKWINADGDADLDILLTGLDIWSIPRLIFLENNANRFNLKSTGIFPYPYSVSALDYDNNHRADILAGNKLIRHRNAVVNTVPSVPSGLNTLVSGKNVTFHWNASVDDKTPVKGIRYKIWVGTGKTSADILSPLSDLKDGSPKNYSLPLVGSNCSWKLNDLSPGWYYWSVQAVDNCMNYTGFAPVDSFLIEKEFSSLALDGTNIYSYTNYGNDVFAFADFDEDSQYEIITVNIDPGNDSHFKQYQGENGIITGNYRRFRLNCLSDIADYNKDNFPDIAVSFQKYDNSYKLVNQTKIFHYIKDSMMEDPSVILPVIRQNSGQIQWIDFDHDGDRDIFVTGDSSSTSVPKPFTCIYKNERGLFTGVNANLTPLYNSNGAWFDYDNDLDNDLAISGIDNNGNKRVFLYLNDGKGELSLYKTLFSDRYGKVYAGDFTNDGRPDLFLYNMYDGLSHSCKLLINTGDVFEQSKQIFRSDECLAFGDFNNDGWLDVITDNIFHKNLGNDNWEISTLGFEFAVKGIVSSEFAQKHFLCDVNGDSRLDIIAASRPFYTYDEDNLGYANEVYFNNWVDVNPDIEKPVHLQYMLSQLDVIFAWDEPAGTTEPLTYNVRLGTMPGGSEIINPLSDNSGFRRVVGPGNAQYNKRWIIRNLPEGTYYWSVQAVDHSFKGGAWADEQVIQISNIRVDFSADTVCHGNTTSFADTSTVFGGTADSWNWNFGDGTYSSLRNPTHHFTNSGIHNVKLTVTSGQSVDSITKPVYVKPKPHADFAADLVCEGNKTSFDNHSRTDSITVSSLIWRFGDGDFSNATDSIEHPYLAPGNYYVSLEISATNGCADSITKTVTVAAMPNNTIGLYAGYAVFCEGDSCELSVPYNETYLYQWKLNDVNISGATANRLKVWNSGYYSAVIVNPVGNCIVESEKLPVTAVSAPESPTIYAAGQVQFCDGDSVRLYTDYDPNYVYQWKRDDGNTGTNSHEIYALYGGDYKLVVEVIGAGECTEAESNVIKITTMPKPDKPSIGLDRQAAICTGESVTLSVPASSSWVTCQWRRNANNITGATNSTYSATTAGDYSVRITNANGCSAESNPLTVTVSDPPRVDRITLLSDDTVVCQGQTVSMSVPYSPDYTYQWYRNWILLSGATGANLEAEEEGSYNVIVSNNKCSDTTQPMQIRFKPGLPKPAITAYGPNTWYLVCGNDTAKFYKWYYNGTQVYNKYTYIYFANQDLGEYRVTISDDDECYASSDMVSIPLTGEWTEEGGNSVILYPNPGNGTFYMRGLVPQGSRIQYSLTNLLGNEVAGGEMTVPGREILCFDFQFLQAGIYFIAVFNDESIIYTGKLVIN